MFPPVPITLQPNGQTTEAKPTYAQVAASPPRTPTKNVTRVQKPHTPIPVDEPEACETEEDSTPPSPTPPQKTRETPAEKAQSEKWSSVDGRGSSLCSEARRLWKKEEQDAIMHYGYPTLEDWKNLSVHGNDSMSSEMVKDCLGETLANFGGDIEKHVTDGIDRHGHQLPEYERIQEEEQSRKRQRTGDETPKEPRRISIRFRKYRPKPSAGATPCTVNPLEKVKEWIDATGPPHPQPPNGELGTTTEQSHNEATGAGRKQSQNSHHTGERAAPTPPSPHLRDEDYANINASTHRPSYEPMNIDTHDEAMVEAPPETPPRPEQTRTQPSRPGRPTKLGLRDFEITPTAIASPEPRTGQAAPRRATPAPAGYGADGTTNPLAASATQNMTAITEEEEYALTPTPDRGFPDIHHARPESLTEDLAQRRINDLWRHDQERFLLLHVANVGYPSPGQRSLLSVEITGLIRAHTGESDFVVVAPEPEWVEPPARRRAPRTWAVLGLPREAVATVADKRILSSIWVTIIAYTRKLMIPRFLFTLTGFTNNYNDNIRTAIMETFASDPIYSSILELVQGHPMLTDLDPDEAVAEVLSTLDIRIDKLNNGNLQAAVFCDPPTTSGAKWLEWRLRLMSLPFESSYNPTATAKPIEFCGCCHSADHVTHMCKLPTVPGWNAPPPETRTFGRPRRQLAGQAPATTAGPGLRGRGRGWAPGRGGRYQGQEQGHPQPSYGTGRM